MENTNNHALVFYDNLSWLVVYLLQKEYVFFWLCSNIFLVDVSKSKNLLFQKNEMSKQVSLLQKKLHFVLDTGIETAGHIPTFLCFIYFS